MRQAIFDDCTGEALQTDAYRQAINCDLTESFYHDTVVPQKMHRQPGVEPDEGNFVILDDITRRYSDVWPLAVDSDAYLDACLRVLQFIGGRTVKRNLIAP